MQQATIIRTTRGHKRVKDIQLNEFPLHGYVKACSKNQIHLHIAPSALCIHVDPKLWHPKRKKEKKRKSINQVSHNCHAKGQGKPNKY